MERWRHGAALFGINRRCRVHRAEILRVSGPCDEAEAEALGARDELRPWMRREFGWPLVELGNIRLRSGDLAGAEEAFVEAHQYAWSPQPGLALVRLAQGEVEAAAAMISDAIEHPLDVPSKERPPFGDVRLAPLLYAQAEIAFAACDTESARMAADRLADIASRYPGPFLRSWAALAAARPTCSTATPLPPSSDARSPWPPGARWVHLSKQPRPGCCSVRPTSWREGRTRRGWSGARRPLTVGFSARGGQREIDFEGNTSSMRDLKGGSSEHARTSVTRSIRFAIDQLAERQPELAAHLQNCVHTGTYCSYRPDSLTPMEWQLRRGIAGER